VWIHGTSCPVEHVAEKYGREGCLHDYLVSLAVVSRGLTVEGGQCTPVSKHKVYLPYLELFATDVLQYYLSGYEI
jgi:hypothetical protein